MVDFVQSHYNKVVENMAYNVIVVVENIVHKSENMIHRTHIAFHNYFVVNNNMKVC